uniref:Uncharacterized protein n=1 Tax=Avena sativa TaxID=4498 RepID=A0ACD5XYX2_AVESA
MAKHGDGDDGLRLHHAIRVPLTAAAATPAMGEEDSSSSDPDLASDPDGVSLLQRASNLVSTSVITAYHNKPASFWFLLALSAGAMLTAFPASSLLSRVYYDGGGQSKWILSWSAVAGWPIPALLLPACYLLLDGGASPTWPPPLTLCLWYALLGLLSAADNLMYAWAYAYLPASTASLVAASSLAFSAVFGRVIVRSNNGMGLATVNAIVVITAGVVIVALDSGSDGYPGITDAQYAIGFALDVLGSALHGLIFALSELAFATHLAAAAGNDGAASSSSRFFHVVLEQQAAVSLCAFAFTSAGLAVFGEGFGAMRQEAAGFAGGRGAYAMVLGWSAATFQVGVLGATGVVYLGSTVLAGVLNAVRVPVTSVAAVIWFHDPMSGFKILSLVITVWGFGSYMVGSSGAAKKTSRRDIGS